MSDKTSYKKVLEELLIIDDRARHRVIGPLIFWGFAAILALVNSIYDSIKAPASPSSPPPQDFKTCQPLTWECVDENAARVGELYAYKRGRDPLVDGITPQLYDVYAKVRKGVYGTLKVTRDGLVIPETHGKKGEIIARLPPGTEMQVLSLQTTGPHSKWLWVLPLDGKQMGYLSKDQIDPVRPDQLKIPRELVSGMRYRPY